MGERNGRSGGSGGGRGRFGGRRFRERSANAAAGDEYEFFQLYDPDDSELDEDEDPDVRWLLRNPYSLLDMTGTAAAGAAGAAGSFCCTCLRGNCPVCLHKYCRVEFRRSHMVVAGVAALICVLTIGLALGLTLGKTEDAETVECPEGKVCTADGDTVRDESVLRSFSEAAVAVDGKPCAKIGKDVLARNGTAADAAVAALFCNGLINSHSMGIGGGFLMTLYHKKTGITHAVDARETAPAATTVDMYHGDETQSAKGPRSAGVPGEILGYWEIKQRFGNPAVSWASLLEPSIRMAKEGIPVFFSCAEAMAGAKESIFADPGMRDIFINPKTNDTWKEGDTYKRLNLAKTLERIAANGGEEFYSGETADLLAKDIDAAGGIITKEDLKDYTVKITKAVNVKVGDTTVHSVPPPGSGSILVYILNILKHYDLGPNDLDDPLLYHRIVEAFKWAYAVRTRLGDPSDPAITKEVNELVANMSSDAWAEAAFSKIDDEKTVNDARYYGADYSTPAEDHGTAHLSVLAPNGDAVSATSTVNLHFGSKFMSPSTGIILNDEMDDFSFPGIVNYFGVPPSEANFPRPGKRPLSSMSPAVLTSDGGDVRMVVGAAGGTKITTAVALTIIRNLWLGQDIKSAIDDRRIHHQLAPMKVQYEEDFPEDILSFLKTRGHRTEEYDLGGSIVCGISREKQDGSGGSEAKIFANADFRKAGGVDGF